LGIIYSFTVIFVVSSGFIWKLPVIMIILRLTYFFRLIQLFQVLHVSRDTFSLAQDESFVCCVSI